MPSIRPETISFAIFHFQIFAAQPARLASLLSSIRGAITRRGEAYFGFDSAMPLLDTGFHADYFIFQI